MIHPDLKPSNAEGLGGLKNIEKNVSVVVFRIAVILKSFPAMFLSTIRQSLKSTYSCLNESPRSNLSWFKPSKAERLGGLKNIEKNVSVVVFRIAVILKSFPAMFFEYRSPIAQAHL